MTSNIYGLPAQIPVGCATEVALRQTIQGKSTCISCGTKYSSNTNAWRHIRKAHSFRPLSAQEKKEFFSKRTAKKVEKPSPQATLGFFESLPPFFSSKQSIQRPSPGLNKILKVIQEQKQRSQQEKLQERRSWPLKKRLKWQMGRLFKLLNRELSELEQSREKFQGDKEFIAKLQKREANISAYKARLEKLQSQLAKLR